VKKILLLIILILLTGGCKVEYNLMVSEDLKIIETVNMTGTKSLFDIYYKSSKLNVVKMLLDDDKDTLDENNYNYKIVEETTPYVLADKEYSDMKSFANNSIFYKQYFEKLECEEKDGIITLKTSGFKPNDPDDPSRYDVRKLAISITSKYKVIDSNASRVDKKTNTYYWNIDNNTTDFELMLSYDSDVKFNPYINTYIMIIVSILIIIITWGLIWYFDQKEKKNKKKKLNK